MQRLVEREERDKYEIGDKIRNRREELKLSQDQLADIVGTSRKAVSRYETGDREMGITFFTQYADALEINPAKLLPDRFQNKETPTGKQTELLEVTAGLCDSDLEILIAMAARMKK